MTEYAMQPPASPEAESPLAAAPPAELLTASVPLEGQDALQQYMLKCFKVLELQLTLAQQRHHDLVEEELHKMRQQLAAAVQEQHQYQQTVSATVRETIAALRKELADTLQYISQDMAQTLRQTESHTKHALENLRDEMRYLLSERDQSPRRQIQRESSAPSAPALHPPPEDRHA